MNEKKWEAVRQFYMESFNIAPELVDLMASNEILLMCVSGSSNSSISKLLDIDEESIQDIIETVLDFKGWQKDLAFSPYKLYKEDPTLVGFLVLVKETNDYNDLIDFTIAELETMYFSCLTYSCIEDQLEKEWV